METKIDTSCPSCGAQFTTKINTSCPSCGAQFTTKIDDSIIRLAVDGLVETWADTFRNEKYFVQGKAITTYQLKPYVKAALAEPGSYIHGFFRTSPEMAPACITYASLPTECRAIILVLAGKDIEDKIYIFKDYFYGIAVLYINFGITATEAERRLEQSFKRVLERLTLKELLTKLTKPNLHTLLEALPLFPGSIAGADRRLKNVLVSRRNEVSETITYYEQDLKIALWDCWNGSHIDECLKILCRQGDIRQQIATLRRILDGEEPELVRIMMLSMVRKSIEDLDDIKDTIKERRDWEEYQKELRSGILNQDRPLGHFVIRDEELKRKIKIEPDSPLEYFPIRDEGILGQIEAKQDELQRKLSPNEIEELLKEEGISKDDLTEKDWWLIFQLNDEFYQDAEVASKKGLSLYARFGDDFVATRKQLSRLRKKVMKLKARNP